MINNLAYWDYHRENGVSASQYNVTSRAYKERVYTPTEGYISLLNGFTNSYLSVILKVRLKWFSGFVSPTRDSDMYKTFVETVVGRVVGLIIGFTETVVYPLSLSLGMPIVLYSLVMEREKKLRKLMGIMGVTSGNYWKAFIFFYFIMLFTVNCFFLLMGRLLIGGHLFDNKSISILLFQYCGWDLSQIGFALLLSSWITDRHTALYLGYSLNFFLIVLVGNISLFFFPSPSQLPVIFFVLPHSCLVRGIYHQIKHCIEGQCITHPLPTHIEHWVSLVLPYFHAIAFFIAGLAYYDSKSYRSIVRAVKFRAKAIRENTGGDVADPNLTQSITNETAEDNQADGSQVSRGHTDSIPDETE